MSTWSFYDSTTGEFYGATFSGPPDSVKQNTPNGYIPIQGLFTPRGQRVDLATGKVVDYVPPKPPDTEFFTHVWSDDLRAWESRPTRAGLIAQNDDLLKVRMAQAEAKQARAVRDIALAAALGTPPPRAAVLTLQEVEAEVSALRAKVGKGVP